MGLVSAEVDAEASYAALHRHPGAEDAFGDMGLQGRRHTREFVTAIQLDTKLGIRPRCSLAPTQAQDARDPPT